MDRHFPPQSPPTAGAPEAAGAPEVAADPEDAPESVDGALAVPDGTAAVTTAVVFAGGPEFEAPDEEQAERPNAARDRTRRRTGRTLHKDARPSLFFCFPAGSERAPRRAPLERLPVSPPCGRAATALGGADTRAGAARRACGRGWAPFYPVLWVEGARPVPGCPRFGFDLSA